MGEGVAATDDRHHLTRTAPTDEPSSPTERSVIDEWFAQPGSPLVLALVRLAVFGGIIYTATAYDPRVYAGLPEELILEPDIGGRLLALLPMSPTLAAVTWTLMVAAAALAMVGWRVAMTGTVTVVLATYVFGLSTMFGKVDHNHHLLWVGALMAASPCADRLAIGTKGRRPAGSAAYGFPLRVTWLLIGLLYLGAGIPKLRDGIDWIVGENLRNQMWIHWYVLDHEPPFRIDHHPWLYEAAALATVVFEVGFVVAVLWHVTRRVAVILGIGFHVGTQFALGIFFPTLVPLYVSFLPHRGPVENRRPTTPSTVVGIGLLAAVAATSVLTIPNGWPVGSYPPFRRSGPELVLFVAYDDDGIIEHDDIGLNEDAWRWLVQRVGNDPAVAPALAEHLDIDGLRIVAQRIDTDPDHTRILDQSVVWPHS